LIDRLLRFGGRRTVVASMWTGGSFFAFQLIRFASNLILTRLLVPEAFGLMFVATAVMIGLAMFSDVGIRASVIRHADAEDPRFLGTAWVIQVTRGIGIWLLIVALAGVLQVAVQLGLIAPGSVYSSPDLPLVLVISTLTAAISGFQSMKATLANRNLVLGRLTTIQIAARLSGFLVTLTWALISPSVWALVVGGLVAPLLTTIASFLILPGPNPRPAWDRGVSREIWRFGRWLLISSILNFIGQRGDRFVFAALLTPTQLGVYAIAVLIVEAAYDSVGRLIQTVSYAALSRTVREFPEVFSRAFYKHFHIFGIAAFACAAALATAGQDLIAVLYDDRYLDAGWMVQILAITVAVATYNLRDAAFMALDRSREVAAISLIRIVSMIVFVIVFYDFWGVAGAIWGVAIGRLPSVLYATMRFRRLGYFHLGKELVPFLAVPVGVGVGLAVMYGLAQSVPHLLAR
jgi:O-antigen/teichoic acid export membrane protein